MNEVKRWAKQYLALSPLFKSKLFSQPNNEHIMRINSLLFASYSLKMYKNSFYDREKVVSLLDGYPKHQNQTWMVLSKAIIKGIFTPSEDLSQDKIKFWTLLSLMFNRQISSKEFKDLSELYLSLSLQDKITQFEHYVLDQSFYQLYQLSIFSGLGIETAIDAIDSMSIKFLEKIVENGIKEYFSLILILQRIPQKLSDSPKLTLLSQWLSLNPNFKQLYQQNPEHQQWLQRQSLRYMLWLLNVRELGIFVQSQTKRNYLYGQYIDKSLQLIIQLLEILKVKEETPFQQLAILHEISFKMQKIQQIQGIFPSAKQNMKVQHLLQKIKTATVRYVDKKKISLTDINDFGWVASLNALGINFYSQYIRNIIREALQNILGHQYFNIIVDDDKINNFYELSLKIEEDSLSLKFGSKLKDRKIDGNIPLISFLSSKLLGSANSLAPTLQIVNIFELKRVKSLLLKLNYLNNKTESIQSNGHHQFLIALTQKLQRSDGQLQKQRAGNELSVLFVRFLK